MLFSSSRGRDPDPSFSWNFLNKGPAAIFGGFAGATWGVVENTFALGRDALRFMNNAEIIMDELSNPYARRDQTFRNAWNQNQNTVDAFTSVIMHPIDTGHAILESFDQRFKHVDQEYAAGNYWSASFERGRTCSDILQVALGAAEIKYGYTAATLHKKVHSTNWNHAFAPKGTIPRRGHLEDTFLNRREVVKTFSQTDNYLGTNQWGNDVYAKMRPNGTQTWVEMRGGRLENAGRNEVPREFHPKTGLKAPIKPSKKP